MSRLASLVFGAMYVFCVRMYVDYLVLVVSAVSVWRVCMHDVCGGLVCLICVGTCMRAVCEELVCMMCRALDA